MGSNISDIFWQRDSFRDLHEKPVPLLEPVGEHTVDVRPESDEDIRRRDKQ